MADALIKRKIFYQSKILNLKIYRHFYQEYGFHITDEYRWFIIPDWNKLEINLKGANKTLTLKELKNYIQNCLKSPDKEIANEACEFSNKYKLLLRN
jgi:hypothetical protein